MDYIDHDRLFGPRISAVSLHDLSMKGFAKANCLGFVLSVILLRVGIFKECMYFCVSTEQTVVGNTPPGPFQDFDFPFFFLGSFASVGSEIT